MRLSALLIPIVLASTAFALPTGVPDSAHEASAVATSGRAPGWRGTDGQGKGGPAWRRNRIDATGGRGGPDWRRSTEAAARGLQDQA
ncbi:hypothetical protein BKA70DRAFT_1252210 [Coprinopsis sp. MPI-PUGE-AT-0042]|nr:hypothetical protein BKA70DRAFT_1252210 [Coprinopsis sp. MPI-PUGE-AT-0042]